MKPYANGFNWLYFAQHNPALASASVIVAVLVVSYLVYQLLFLLLAKKGSPRFAFISLAKKYCYGPGMLTLFGLGLTLAIPMLPLPAGWLGIVNRTLAIFQIFCITLLAIRLIGALREYVEYRYTQAHDAPGVGARRAFTQYKIFERILVFIIIVLGLVAALMTFDEVRKIGVSLLASAGVLGVIVGIAAQRSLGSVLAGIQIAISQPIRIDDVVVVENEWGRVEEVTLTYVVIRLWDERSLIIPINYFIEKPFYNWTRLSSDIQGTVLIQLDLAADIESIRAYFLKTIAANPLWDRRKAIAQVVNVHDRVMELRMLVSAANANALWDLRCEIREAVLAHIAVTHPDSLPRNRVISFSGDPQPLEATEPKLP